MYNISKLTCKRRAVNKMSCDMTPRDFVTRDSGVLSW